MNTMGYYAIFLGFQVHSDRKFTSRLESDRYAEDDLITIKVPVSIPYMMDREDYSRADGKFSSEGRQYRMVKQKYAQDTLTIVCVRDTDSEQIQVALSDYVSTFTDSPAQPAKHTSKASISFIKDFLAVNTQVTVSVEGWQSKVSQVPHPSLEWTDYVQEISYPPERG